MAGLSSIVFGVLMVGLMALWALVQATPQPEQIHISNTGDPTEMMITWVTLSEAVKSVVEYGERCRMPLSKRAYGSSTEYNTCGWKKRKIYIHRVKLEGLVPGRGYDYRVGSSDGWSALYNFNATRNGTSWAPRFAIYGDLGTDNSQSLSKLQREVQSGRYDAILHVGDFAYNMESDNSKVGDKFMNQIEPMAAYVPYMTCPGNHEEACNFSNYKERFSMPGDTKGIYYSFSTELYYYLKYGLESLVQQYKWLQKDLKEASRPENRAKRPWIITMGHRPMYCSNAVGDSCENHENAIRTGLSSEKLFPLEELFYKHGVDVEFWAHEHSYERLFPVYNHKVYSGSEEKPYTNPKAPGCKYCHDKFKRDYGPWTAFRSLDYGYTRVQVFNRLPSHRQSLDHKRQTRSRGLGNGR
ncbi:Acid phosphatase type 7 [Acropora cervicornis]|uniref:Purple acid phosphatase n=1 Tax=Acropora cervicornis TaxID=6130 RepID=A0AAD9QGS6_ACRCE|nr:Acid phosphatase type 7 [Acropora cervicornis]